ncbi:MAG TPA: glycosyltransferase family 4 protein [Thermoplasmata archaeon]|nr:glycosyltransferase family 4 protein [Thermoplasmata archaeon]
MAGWRLEFLATAPPDDPTSGLSRVVWELAIALSGRGHTARVLFPGPGTAPSAYRGVAAVPVPEGPASRRPFGRDIAIGRNASRLLDPRSDVVVGNDEKAGALATPARRHGRPVFVMMVHDVGLHAFDTLRPLEPDRGWRQRLGNWLDRRALRKLESTALRRASVVLVGSELNRRLLEEHYRLRGPRVEILPYGVPDPVDVGPRDDARRTLKVPLDVPVVSFIGRNPERQGLPIALEAFRRVRTFFPGARFLVAGASVPAEPGVMPLGTVDETTKARVLRASDVFLFPTHYEGFGLAPREAMRYGVATIVSRSVPLDGADPKRTTRVVATDEAGDYASELAELLADPPMRRAIGEAGRAYADGFSYARMAERFERIVAPWLS